MAEDVGITIAVRGGRQATAEAKQVSSAIGGIGHAAGGVAAAGVSKLGAGMDRLGSSLLPIGGLMRSVRQHAFYLGAGIAGIGTLAVKSGLEFNSSMEQNQVAFSHFLGSTQKANDYLGRLYKLAATTPFEFPQVTSAAQKFLAFGFSADEAYKTLNAVGDAAAGLGTGAEGIDRITLALGQMRAAGVVQGDELRQLQEAGINPYRYLERAGLITKGDIGQIGQMHIDANKAISAIVGGIEADPTKGGFGGLAAAQGKTFAGQVSTLRDYTNQTLGTITRPLFDQLEKRGLPAMTSFAKRTTEIWKGDGPFSDKVAQTEIAFHHRFDPMIHAAEHAIGEMHIGTWLSRQFEKDAPKVMNAMGKFGGKALGAFANAWWHAGPYGKLFGALIVGSKLGVFSTLGSLAAGRFDSRFASTVGRDLPGKLRTQRAAFRTAGSIIGGLVGVWAAYEIAKEIGGHLSSLGIDIAGDSVQGKIAADTDPSVKSGRALINNRSRMAAMRAWQRAHPGLNLAMDPRRLAQLGDPALIPGAPGVPSSYRVAQRAISHGRTVTNVYLDGHRVAHIITTNHGKTLGKGVHKAAKDAKAARSGG